MAKKKLDNTTKSYKDIEKFIALRAKKMSIAKISKEIGVNTTKLYEWDSEYTGQIEDMHSILLEELYEKHAIYKDQRIDKLSNITTKMYEELIERDFKDVPLERLLEQYLKYNKEISELTGDSRKDEEKVILPVKGGMSITYSDVNDDNEVET